MKVTVIGAGAWGTALADLLCQNGNEVTLWGNEPALLREVQRTGRNEVFLPGIQLSAQLRYEPDLLAAAAAKECLVVAVPSKFLREVTARLPWFRGIAVSVTKGIEDETGLTMSGILRATMPEAAAGVLSGPSFALEVAQGIPGAIVAAHPDPAIAKKIQLLFHRPTFRVYTSRDVLGVELGGALKNVVAITAGVGDGLGFGDNTKAALVNHPGHGGNPAAGGGLRRQRGNFFRLERVGGFDRDLLFALEPEPPFWRTGRARGKGGGHCGRRGGGGGRLSDGARGASFGGPAGNRDAHRAGSLCHAL